jgi:hypothetical protein
MALLLYGSVMSRPRLQQLRALNLNLFTLTPEILCEGLLSFREREQSRGEILLLR